MAKAPSGEWKPQSPDVERALGRFIIAWSLVESIIEVGIAKQLGIGPHESSMITGTMMFQPKANLLLALLMRDKEKNKSAIKQIKKAQGIPHRNTIMHSVIGGAEWIIWFNRRRNDGGFTSTIEKYTFQRLNFETSNISQVATDLQLAMSISADEYIGFFQTAHNSANNVEESNPPDSTI